MIAVNVPSGLMMVFNGATCYSFPDWAMLQVKGVDYVYVGTIRFSSLSDHTWLYFPGRFFCCLECHVNRILPLLSSSVRTDVLFVRWKELVGLLLFFFAVFLWMAPTVDVMFLFLLRWDFWMLCTCCKASWDSMWWFMEVHLWEHLFDLSTNFGLPLFEAWAYQLKKISVRRARVCGLIMPGQGEFYIIVFHWRSVKPTLMSRGDIVEPRLEWLLQSPLLCLWCAQRCRYTLQMNLCQCFLFSFFRLLMLYMFRLKAV